MAAKTKSIPAQALRWRFDVNTFRLLGRELITDRITAVFELVKNCYDANATKVAVDFHNVNPPKGESKITILDNGIGMSFEDIRDKWMVVGTKAKRTALYSPKPFNRKYVGQKGIGRFAVDKLGGKLLIKTKQIGTEEWLCVKINWEEYEELAAESTGQLSLFTEVDNEFYYEPGEKSDQGTVLEITSVRENWTPDHMERLYKELSKLVSPFYPVKPPFDIALNSNEVKDYSNRPVKPDPIKFYSHYAEIGYDLKKGTQEILKFDTKKNKIGKEVVPIKPFGPVHLKVFYFDEKAKKKYNTAYKHDDTRIDGIKIYRDGIIATPFAEFHSNPNFKRDILGIDKRRWGGAFDKVSTRELIGVLDISQELNPKIIDATNRQDFIENEEYSQLKEFILAQIDIFAKQKVADRDAKRSVVEKKLQSAGSEVKNFKVALDKIEQELMEESPQLKEKFNPLKKHLTELGNAISESISEQKKYQQDVVRRENIFMSLMSLQDYASNISHAIRTSLGKIKRMAEFFKINFPNSKYEDLFKKYAILINDEMSVLLRVTDFMLSYASSEIDFEDFSLKEMFEDLMIDKYSQTFQDEKIRVELEFKDDFIVNANKKFFQDIFQNLISNSIKALKNTENKVIKCSGFLNEDNFTMFFSDNGGGVPKGDEKWIFELYNTRTAEQGGAGLGLYIVEKRIEALKGTIELVENELKPTGATFKIQLPFNRT